MLLQRLNTDRSIAPLVAQFVPLKINTDSDDWHQWLRSYPPPGPVIRIPILYVVRADGELLFQQSGLLSGPELPAVMTETLKRAGKLLNDRQIALLESAAREAKSALEAGKLDEAVEALSAAREIGPLGQLGSFAESASECDRIVGELTEQARNMLADVSTKLSSDQPDFEAAYQCVRVQRIFKPLLTLKKELDAVRGLSRKPTVRDLIARARTLDRILLEAEKETTRARGVQHLTEFISDLSPEAPERKLALLKLSELHGAVMRRREDDVLDRIWTDNTGTKTLRARLLGVADGFVVLHLIDGRTSEVSFERLSERDRIFARLMRARFNLDRSRDNR